ncbi:hypothetical protein OG689_26165 [Kitasatospora sp. NBC_00240]|uniref:hypothetical protein n=1 Tax=Kitasatospora sp. NBC_00240 TaxID=2903567 RepID=UPI00225A872B|nr:hypothetical protein [Kitasatospora sp. NBC_00240]MCX5212726.1 hypothetical protein [Kitasatospora sp. NBC_00240]
MPSHRPVAARPARLALAAATTLAAALALTACGPEENPGVADGPAATAPVAAPSSPAAAPASTAPAASRTPAPAPTTTAAPAGKRQVAAARTAGGLAVYTGPGAVSDVVIDPGEMRPGMNLVVSEYAPAGKGDGRRILLVAVDNVPEDSNKRREHLWRGLIDHALQNGSTGTPGTAAPYGPGPLGGSVECLGLPEAPSTDVLCGWADAGTAGVALFPRTTVKEAAALFLAMRSDVEH